MKFTLFAALLFCVHANAQTHTPPSTPAQPVSPPGVSATHSSEGAPKHNDAQIVAIVTEANQADINGGKLAEGKANRQDVKDYAKEMIKDHSAAQDKLKKVMSMTKMMRTENDTSKGMKKMAEATTGHLKSVKHEDFDREYIDSELAMHQQVLTDLDEDLIPNAHDAELKNYLKEIRPTIASHLEKAKNIQTSMNSKK